MKKIVLAVTLIGLLGFFSSLSAQVVVPNVMGKDFNEAVKELQKAGLKPGNVNSVPAAKQELNNKVAGQAIPGGAKLPSPQPINLTVYRFQADQSELVTVPNVVGMEFLKAVNAFNAAGITAKRRDKETYDPKESEKVFGQGIAAGQKVRKGTVVELIVNKMPPSDITVPNVVGAPYPEAATILSKALLTPQMVSGVSEPTDDPQKNGRVFKQNPEAGKKVAKHTVVHLLLYAHKKTDDMVTVPNIIGATANQSGQIIKQLGFKSCFFGCAYLDPSTKDKVADQYPKPGTKVKKGTHLGRAVYTYQAQGGKAKPCVFDSELINRMQRGEGCE
jgi:beta-lactam-binding protein with PASTA domain